MNLPTQKHFRLIRSEEHHSLTHLRAADAAAEKARWPRYAKQPARRGGQFFVEEEGGNFAGGVGTAMAAGDGRAVIEMCDGAALTEKGAPPSPPPPPSPSPPQEDK